jgi:hypothetical protein
LENGSLGDWARAMAIGIFHLESSRESLQIFPTLNPRAPPEHPSLSGASEGAPCSLFPSPALPRCRGSWEPEVFQPPFQCGKSEIYSSGGPSCLFKLCQSEATARSSVNPRWLRGQTPPQKGEAAPLGHELY